MAEIALGVRVLSGSPHRPRVVRFRHPEPRATNEHRRIFDCPIDFRAARTEIVFDDAVLEARMQYANDVFLSIFERQVELALARLPPVSSASAAVRAAVRAALAGGSCTLSGTARTLGVSTRTLQRRLHAEGTSFAELVDALRQRMAVAYLERRLSIADVSFAARVRGRDRVSSRIPSLDRS
jgi:AraC-like DNA-binding protein